MRYIFLFLFSFQVYGKENSLDYKVQCKSVNYRMEISKFEDCLQYTKLDYLFR